MIVIERNGGKQTVGTVDRGDDSLLRKFRCHQDAWFFVLARTMSWVRRGFGAERGAWTVLLGLLLVSFPVVAQSAPASNAPVGAFLHQFASSATVSNALFGPDNGWDSSYDAWQSWKENRGLPITFGAYNWYHINSGGPTASGYGIPGLRGTYFWYVDTDPSWSVNDGFIKTVGVHTEFRFRESDKFRSYFSNQYWFYEAFGFVDTPVGRFKAGQIWKRFGLDWDGTWWGNVQYFDGLKLDTGYGVSWENTWMSEGRFKVDSFVQYFVDEANVSGSLAGANPQSVPGSRERSLGVVRVIPTWQLNDASSFALGFSGLIGQIKKTASFTDATRQTAWAVDATYTWNDLKVFSEVDQSSGVLNPNRYVSGGPSNRTTDELFGAIYQFGPIGVRAAWSTGFDAHPSGHQDLWVPGVTIALAKNATLYAEYVRWTITDSAAKRAVFEDGIQLALHWHV
ncbi:MAG: hypothetical protein KGJ79_16015 [Alphaproteobacteria bacterium]|nr:hypothetical protein [Alphaproteobacteria bacterium]MDE2493565.1 hypothetical protein [Alphaproteobacteria bacterium]